MRKKARNIDKNKFQVIGYKEKKQKQVKIRININFNFTQMHYFTFLFSYTNISLVKQSICFDECLLKLK